MALRDIKDIVLSNYIGQFRACLRFKHYYSSLPPSSREGAHKRRARLKNAIGSFSDSELGALYSSVEGRCYWCGICTNDKSWHADHYVPLALRGPNCIENIVISCQKCNNQKGAQDPLIFAARINKNEGKEKRDQIFKIANMDKEKYHYEAQNITQNPLIITVCYLDKINAYAFMFSKFNAQIMSVFSIYYKNYPLEMKFSKYNSGQGQNVWLIHEKLFDDIFNSLISLKDKNIKFRFIKIAMLREQENPTSSNFTTPSFRIREKPIPNN